MATQFRKATFQDAPEIWELLQYAIQKRKLEGSTQWQDGYPNPDIIARDVKKGQGFVLQDTLSNKIAGYCAIGINDEPAYDDLEGTWLTTGNFVVFHRAAIAEDYIGQGYAKVLFRSIENYALKNDIYSVKADTNFDNKPMLHLFGKFGYKYCGEVSFRGTPRRAYEKVLNKDQ